MPRTRGNCNCCLYGWITVIPIILCSAGVIMIWVVTYDCRYFAAKAFGRQTDFTIGPFTVEDAFLTCSPSESENGRISCSMSYGSCVGWAHHSILQKEDLDTPIKFVRVIAQIVCWVGIVMWFLVLVLSCASFPKQIERMMAGFFFLLGILTMLTLVMLSSKFCTDVPSCSISRDGILAIFTSFVWFGAAVALLFLPEPRHMNEGAQQQQPPQSTAAASAQDQPAPGTTTETVEQTIVEPDGTTVKMITQTVINADGSKTITETREVQSNGVAAASSSVAAASSVENLAGDETLPVAQAKAVSY